MTNVKKERGAITTDPMDVKMIIKEYNEPLNGHKFDNLDEMGQFFEDTIYQNSHKEK